MAVHVEEKVMSTLLAKQPKMFDQQSLFDFLPRKG